MAASGDSQGDDDQRGARPLQRPQAFAEDGGGEGDADQRLDAAQHRRARRADLALLTGMAVEA